MTPSWHGLPCWYELMTPDPDAAQAFYAGVVGWTVAASGMEDFDYRLASAGETAVAGLMAPLTADMPCFWMIYIAVDSADATAEAAKAAGGAIYKAPADIPGVGRFAVLADPQGAAFGVLQPLPGGQGGAFDQRRAGHGNWHELRSSDPEAALGFYGTLFGWREDHRMEMGPMGFYHIFARGEAQIGGMMPAPPGAPPHWLPYFGAPSIDAAIARITALGGHVLHGPAEVPGGAFIVQASDPQGIAFALVGGR